MQLRSLTTWQWIILSAAAAPMLAVGGLGAWGTYTNMKTQFPQDATALGVVAAGEGATLVLAMVWVGLTLLDQASPTVVRLGLWLLPAIASATGAVVAESTKEAVVYAMTPMAMCASAEGIGLMARRIVVYRTGVDMEARRRNARTMQRLAVQRALSENHPWWTSRKWAELRSWRLFRKVGVGNDALGADLVIVQDQQVTSAAGLALAAMFAPKEKPVTPALEADQERAGSVTPALEAGQERAGSVTATVTDSGVRHGGNAGSMDTVSAAVTQVSAGMGHAPSRDTGTVAEACCDGVTVSGTEPVTETVTDQEAVTGQTVTDTKPPRPGAAMTLEQLAAVANVPTPLPGTYLTDEQLRVVLRHFRHRDDPPRSYRKAVAAFRDEKFQGGEERVRPIWNELMKSEGGDAQEAEEEEEEEASA
ncbi:hypothetical protein [Streptomyces palmae]|nr:hypothetical protein [Streptomyces palmae]